MRTTAHRGGRFTWVTAMIVAGLAVLAIGLILTGLSRAREAAARAKCANNLKQLGLGLLNYHDIYTRYPSGTVPNPALSPERRLSWEFSLIPVLEATDLYNKVDPGGAWDSDRNREQTSKRFTFLHCPALSDGTTAIGSYVGVAGVGPDAAALPGDDPRAGLFGYDRVTRRGDVKDGESATICVAETPHAGPWAQGGPATVRGLDPADRPYLGLGRPYTGHVAEKAWFGRDLTGGNVAFVDGSVRLVSETVSPEVLEALATIAGGETLPADW